MFAWVNLWTEKDYTVILKHKLKKRYKNINNLKKKLFINVQEQRKKFATWKKLKPQKKAKWIDKRRAPDPMDKKRTLWLGRQLATYQKAVPVKARKDFFKTKIGLILATAQRYSYKRPIIWRKLTQASNLEGISPTWRLYRIVAQKIKLGTCYNYNEIAAGKEKISPRKRRRFSTYKLYTEHWGDYNQRPWLTFLLYKRALYAYNQELGIKQLRKRHKRGVKTKPYLRKKTPARTKYNKFYQRILATTTQSESKYRAQRKDKEKYTKQLLQKLIQPFYNIRSIKNFRKKWKLARRKKSVNQTAIDLFLAKYECRLDVLVYRLNFAPTILWARRLIWQGAIFVTHVENMQYWIKNHASLKIYAYPLKLKDPKELYVKHSWNPHNKQTRYNFLIKPMYHAHYIVKPNEIIQYNPLGNLNKFKTNRLLTQKRIPHHLLIAATYKIDWVGYRHRLKTKLIAGSLAKNGINRTATAFLLFKPRILDLSEKDRIKETFFRWTLV